MKFLAHLLLLISSFCFIACSGGSSNEKDSSSSTGGGSNGSTPDGGGNGGGGNTPSTDLSDIANSFSLSTDRVHLSAGESKKITVSLATPAAESTNIRYRVFGPQADGFSDVLANTAGEIFVPAGATSFDFDLRYPSSPSFTGQANLLLVLDRIQAPSASILINLHSDNIRDFDLISAGSNNTCGIRSGELYCWGDDSVGQLGNGNTSSTSVGAPIRIGTSTTWTHVSVGRYHTCGIDSGNLYCWGMDFYGQVGNGPGSNSNVDSPEAISMTGGWTHIYSSLDHNCGIDSGRLFCWGKNSFGQIGDGTTTNATEPTPVDGATNWTDITAGKSFSCGIRGGDLYCWGDDTDGQLGNGATTTVNQTSPVRAGTSSSWTQISSGYSFACGINSGELYCWGSDNDGTVGNGDASSTDLDAPEKIGSSNDWTQISAGYYHICGLRGGSLYCWGEDEGGEIGNGVSSSIDITSPLQIGSSTNWSQISGGGSTTCGINNGSFVCWGSNNSGQLGSGTDVAGNLTQFQKLNGHYSWSKLAAGSSHSCGIEAGALYCWGHEYFGQIGNGDLQSNEVGIPQRIGTSNNWTDISAGQTHSCGINGGELYCWGHDDYGQIGNGNLSTSDITAPEKISSDTTWTQVSAGEMHNCGIKAGKLFCWGRDDTGQVGNGSGSSTNVEAPEQIGTSSTWTHVDAGFFHTCGINSGELYCWGDDSSGQIGNGIVSSTTVYAPEKVGVSSNWTQVSVGYLHSCGIDNGAFYCWGKDDYGQQGNGNASMADVIEPEQVGSSTNWTSMDTGTHSTCGIESGELYCWGEDYAGQIGNGPSSDSDVDSPEKIGTDTHWTQVVCGPWHTLAIGQGNLYGTGTGPFSILHHSPGTLE